jgi:tRNA A37 N6-isopentenylltransferase MiaA
LQHRLGEISEEKAITHSSGRSWAYARRQRTWYRGEPISTTINAGSSQTTARVATDLHAIARTLIEQIGA